jgi:O-methyltransferase
MARKRYGEVKHLPVNPVLHDYMLRFSTPIDPAMVGLIERTRELGGVSAMLIPAEQAVLLTLLTRILGTRTALDIGTFTGCSALAMACGLASGGKVISCDVTDRWIGIAQEHWTLASVADRIDFRLGPAAKTLRELPDDTEIDIAFLDADKEGYEDYYSSIIPLVRPGGLVIADNVFVDGYVLDPELADQEFVRTSATALRAFNAMVAADRRVEAVMLPIADGITIARKK